VEQRLSLVTLGVWDEIQDRLVRADNVRSAMMFVARGEVPLGIVYTTDALADKGVRIVATFPSKSHTLIAYPVISEKVRSESWWSNGETLRLLVGEYLKFLFAHVRMRIDPDGA